MKIAIINLVLSIVLLLLNLVAVFMQNQVYLTPEFSWKAIYNLFIRGNLGLPLIVIYVILSLFNFKRVRSKSTTRK